jgi:hypothetical protein
MWGLYTICAMAGFSLGGYYFTNEKFIYDDIVYIFYDDRRVGLYCYVKGIKYIYLDQYESINLYGETFTPELFPGLLNHIAPMKEIAAECQCLLDALIEADSSEDSDDDGYDF